MSDNFFSFSCSVIPKDLELASSLLAHHFTYCNGKHEEPTCLFGYAIIYIWSMVRSLLVIDVFSRNWESKSSRNGSRHVEHWIWDIRIASLMMLNMLLLHLFNYFETFQNLLHYLNERILLYFVSISSPEFVWVLGWANQNFLLRTFCWNFNFLWDTKTFPRACQFYKQLMH